MISSQASWKEKQDKVISHEKFSYGHILYVE